MLHSQQKAGPGGGPGLPDPYAGVFHATLLERQGTGCTPGL